MYKLYEYMFTLFYIFILGHTLYFCHACFQYVEIQNQDQCEACNGKFIESVQAPPQRPPVLASGAGGPRWLSSNGSYAPRRQSRALYIDERTGDILSPAERARHEQSRRDRTLDNQQIAERRCQELNQWTRKIDESNLQNLKYNEKECCSICLNAYELGEEMTTSPCNHFFHKQCMENWVKQGKNTCPYCNQVFVE